MANSGKFIVVEFEVLESFGGSILNCFSRYVLISLSLPSLNRQLKHVSTSITV